MSASVPSSLLAAALRAQSEGVFIASRACGPKGIKILFVNESFCLMTGRSAGELIGEACTPMLRKSAGSAAGYIMRARAGR